MCVCVVDINALVCCACAHDAAAQIDLTIALLSELVTHLDGIDGLGYCYEEFDDVGSLIETIGERMSDVIAPDDRKELYELCSTLHEHGDDLVDSRAFKDARKLFRRSRERSSSDSDCDDDESDKESDEESEDGTAAVLLCCLWAGTGFRRTFSRWAIDWC